MDIFNSYISHVSLPEGTCRPFFLMIFMDFCDDFPTNTSKLPRHWLVQSPARVKFLMGVSCNRAQERGQRLDRSLEGFLISNHLWTI